MNRDVIVGAASPAAAALTSAAFDTRSGTPLIADTTTATGSHSSFLRGQGSAGKNSSTYRTSMFRHVGQS